MCLILHWLVHTRVNSEVTQERFLGVILQLHGWTQTLATERIMIYTVWPWSALTGGFFSCWCLWSRKHAQMCTRNMTTCSSRPADHIECLIRGQKAEEVGASSRLSFTTCPWVCWHTKVYQPWYNKADNTPKTIKIIQVTPMEHSFPHQSLKGCVKGLSPIPGCWCSLIARSVPVLFPAL